MAEGPEFGAGGPMMSILRPLLAYDIKISLRPIPRQDILNKCHANFKRDRVNNGFCSFEKHKHKCSGKNTL